jgi:hypothetical protein
VTHIAKQTKNAGSRFMPNNSATGGVAKLQTTFPGPADPRKSSG